MDVTAHIWWSEDSLRYSVLCFNHGIPGTKLGSLGLVASTFTCCSLKKSLRMMDLSYTLG